MTTELATLSVDDKERIKHFHKLFKTSPKDVTEEMRKFLSEKNAILWDIKKNSSLGLVQRQEAFDLIRLCHDVLGRDFKEEWKPNEKQNGKASSFATPQQRTTNCNDFRSYMGDSFENLSNYEQTFILAIVWGTVRN